LIIAPLGTVGISTFLFPIYAILTSASHGIISALRDRRLCHGLGITGEGGRQTNEKRPDAIQRGKSLGRQ
jgi:hypothetical protein